MRNTSLEIQPIAGALGAEIGGVDLAENLSDQVISEIRQALLDHCVIFFRDQNLDVDRHKAFARRFGEIFIHPNFRGTQADPEVVNVVRNPGDARIVGEKWHHDTTMVEEPPMGAVFYAIEVPEYGGDTLFANQYLAYETLSPALKALLDGLRVKHTDIKIAGPQAAVSKSRSTPVREDADWRETINFHPAVITHPETGRKALFVNHSHCVAFEGMTEEESKPLLGYLLDHGQRPEFTCRFRYERGSVVFWDNRCVKHMAVNDAGPFRRVARRIQIQGVRPS
jgi:taurine dioxygenase